MNMSLSVMALSVSAAAILILLGAGTNRSIEPVYAQVNVMPGTDEPANTTSSGGGFGYSSRCWSTPSMLRYRTNKFYEIRL